MPKHTSQLGFLDVGDLQIQVKTIDSRQLFGRDELLVIPICGIGSQWVTADRFHLTAGQEGQGGKGVVPFGTQKEE